MTSTVTTIEIDNMIKENNNIIPKLFQKYCFGKEINSVQIISHLLDNHIPKVYLDENNKLILPFYVSREINKLAYHPFVHEVAYQAFALYLNENTDWNDDRFKLYERRLQIFIIVTKHFMNVLNEIKYVNGYSRTAIQEISLHFYKDKFQYYPDYFQEFVKEHILDKYDLIEAQKNIKNSIDWGRIPPKVSDFKLYTNNLIEYNK